jgi:phosphohistidine phosphatase
MRLEALGMKALGLTFDAILSSPYLRARQTAEMVAQVYKLKNKTIHLTDNLLPPASIKALLRDIQAHCPRSKNVLLVGHEPHLSGMVSSLLQCKEPLPIDFKKGGLCCLSVPGPSGESSGILNWPLAPSQLILLAKEKE